MIKFTLTLFLLSLAFSLKESEAGVNDWSRLNIGEVTNVHFFNVRTAKMNAVGVKKPNVLFFQSSLNMVGHINKRNGAIDVREMIQEDERLIDENENSIVLWSKGKQVVVYDTQTMIRATDNRLMKEQYSQINSYLQIKQKIYVVDSKNIYEFQSNMKTLTPTNIISIPTDTICLKGFSIENSDQLHVFTWLQANKQLCFNQISGGGLIQKECFNIPLEDTLTSLSYFKSNKKSAFYFGVGKLHYFFRPQESITQLQAKPISFGSFGAVLENMKTFNQKFKNIEEKLYACSNRDSIIVLAEKNQDRLTLNQYEENGKKSTIATIKLRGESRQKVKRIWVNFIADTEFQILLQFMDLELTLFSMRAGWNEPIENWNREQSLAYLDKVLFMKYEGFTDRLDNEYHRKVNSNEYQKKSLVEKMAEAPINLVLRIQTQIKDIIRFFQEAIVELPHFLSKVGSSSFWEWKNFLQLWKAKMPENEQKKYGLQKYMISVTKKNTMFAIDTKTSDVLWKKQRNPDFKLIGLIKLKKQYERQVAIAVMYANGLTVLEQIKQNGDIVGIQKMKVQGEPTIHKISPHSILLKGNGKISRFDINQRLTGNKKQYFFYQVQNNRLLGWKNVESSLFSTWTFSIPENQKIIKTTSVYRGQPQALLPIPNDKRVIFKNVDFSNIAVITLQQQEGAKAAKIHLYLINGLTGNVLLSEYQTGVHPSLPIDLAYDEHNAIVSYYSSKNRVYEIWSIEGFQNPAEETLLTKLYEPARQRDNIIFRSSLHGIILPIKHIYISQSKEALLRRHLVIITRENKIYMLNRDLISSRRPKSAEPEQNAPEGEFLSSKHPVEEFMLPVMPNYFLNYNTKNQELEKMRFSSTDLESTIFIFTYGVDNYMIRMAPDKPFDILIDGFNYLQLVGVLVIVTVLALYFRNLANQQKLMKFHLD